MRNVVRAIFAHYIVDHLRAALIAEIDIKIRHADALRVEKALKEKVIFHRVNSRDADTVSRDAARSGPPPGADGNAL